MSLSGDLPETPLGAYHVDAHAGCDCVYCHRVRAAHYHDCEGNTMKLYKLTNRNSQTYGGCQWGENVEHTTSGNGELCGPGWLHAYTCPLLAVLLNPIHADLEDPILWEAEGDIKKDDNGLKVGCTRLKTIKQVPLPVVTIEHRIRFAILCAKKVYDSLEWNTWADNWLLNVNKTTKAAETAVKIAEATGVTWANIAATKAAKAALAADAGHTTAATRAAWTISAAVAAFEFADFDLISLAKQAIKGDTPCSQTE